MTLFELLNEFILSRKIRGFTSKTVETYSRVLSAFIKYLGADSDLSVLCKENYNKYICYLYTRNIKQATISNYVRHIKAFLNWIESEYSCDINAKNVKVPKTHKKVVHIYSDKEIQCIFDCITTESEWLTLRNKCIVSLMLDSGLRRGEICNLHKYDLFLDDGYAKVFGKGNKERIAPIGETSKHLLHDYLKMCPYDIEALFVSRRGEPIDYNAVKLLMHKLSKKLPFPLSSHKLRHNYATYYCLDQYEKYGQVDLYKLMILMGHEEVETTRIYLHHANQLIAAKYNISHLDKIKINT